MGNRLTQLPGTVEYRPRETVSESTRCLLSSRGREFTSLVFRREVSAERCGKRVVVVLLSRPLLFVPLMVLYPCFWDFVRGT